MEHAVGRADAARDVGDDGIPSKEGAHLASYEPVQHVSAASSRENYGYRDILGGKSRLSVSRRSDHHEYQSKYHKPLHNRLLKICMESFAYKIDSTSYPHSVKPFYCCIQPYATHHAQVPVHVQSSCRGVALVLATTVRCAPYLPPCLSTTFNP